MKTLILLILTTSTAFAGLFGIPPNNTYAKYRENLVEKKEGYTWLVFVPEPSDTLQQYSITFSASGSMDMLFAASRTYDIREHKTAFIYDVSSVVKELMEKYGAPDKELSALITEIEAAFSEKDRSGPSISWSQSARLQGDGVGFIVLSVEKKGYTKGTLYLSAKFKK